ncbi:FAD-dependent oxidoreductase [Herbidospora sp. NEAU-GS84]|uniref:FAD-dependent oxidoreductase n=1 Tax=Herbidospora solisilvae TaxID=2696284 RepID=A0A7C9NHF1_9ACTN|nr:FAD-dependent oxidoreductase [Herbidospora solisilvae]NAS23078.1 FAD-dependent oxidoreductase [Herbidospora solisilvae]
MSSHAVVIIGGGLEGLSIAAALTARGQRDVLVLERRTTGSGGTAKSSGLVRCHYECATLTAMAWEGIGFFERHPGLGFRQTGHVVGVGEESAAALRANVARRQDLGIDVAMVTHDDVAALWPGLETKDFAAFAFEPRGGHGDPVAACRHFAQAAQRGGARILEHTRVAALLGDSSSIAGVRLADGRVVGARAVIVAAGAWTAELVAPLGVTLPVGAMREPIVIAAPGAPVGPVPAFTDLVGMQYVRHENNGRLLIGSHTGAELTTPDGYLNRATDVELERAAARFTTRFPAFPDVVFPQSYAACYDITPDLAPLVGPAGPEGLYVAAGFSGHGFAISPAVGRICAEMVLGRSAPPQDLSPGRFTTSGP